MTRPLYDFISRRTERLEVTPGVFLSHQRGRLVLTGPGGRLLLSPEEENLDSIYAIKHAVDNAQTE